VPGVEGLNAVLEQFSAKQRKEEAQRLFDLEMKETFATVVQHAAEAGISEDEIEAAAGWADTEGGLKSQYLEVMLADLCSPADVMGSVYICALAVTENAGGKLPASVKFCERVKEMLDEDVTAVDAVRASVLEEMNGEVHNDLSLKKPEEKKGKGKGKEAKEAKKAAEKASAAQNQEAEKHRKKEMNRKMTEKFMAAKEAASVNDGEEEQQHHQEYERLLRILTDPYLLYVVLPQLESWQALFNIFDLKRNGRVSYSELNQGLCTSCSPEIEIIQNASMVKQLLNAMAFVAKEKELVELVIDLCVDNPPAFGSRASYTSVCRVTEVKKRSPSAVHHCLEHFPEDWKAFK
jgi:hypothetical protein